MFLHLTWIVILIILFQGNCGQGFEEEKLVGCDCNPGFTGKNCKTELFSHMEDYYQSSSGETNHNNEEVCNGGKPTYEKSCVCDAGFTGKHCNTMLLGSDGSGDRDGNKLGGRAVKAEIVEEKKKLIWRGTTKSVDPYNELVERGNVINNFVKVSTGLKGSGSSLKMAKDPQSADGFQYKFDFQPTTPGRKSRLELSTCYVLKSDYLKEGHDINRLRDDVPSMLQHLCPVVRMPIEALHKYSYQLRIMKRDFPDKGSYILTQWHGTSDGKILKDDNGCIARVKDEDLVSLCEDGICTKGRIMTNSEDSIGLRYEQGGYPPLSFHFKDSTFYVIARSDEREFIAKSGCHPGTFDKDHFHCPLHPRQQYHVIWKRKFKDFPFNKWNSFTWKIKWSEYGNDYSQINKNNENYDGGVLLSNAWIRLWINSKLEIDWKGPCGRNDDGRVPYFKMGIYNPSGSIEPVLFRTRGFGYTYNLLERESESEEKEQINNLRIYPRGSGNDKMRNSNELKYGLKFDNTVGNICTLEAESSQLATIASVKYAPIKNNKQIRRILRAMADIIMEQQQRIKQLESKHSDLKKVDKKEEEDDEAGEYDEELG